MSEAKTQMNVVYRVSGPRVIFENIEGELILVHMERGTYYSTDEVGAHIWSMVEAQSTLSEICGSLESCYDAPSEAIRHAVEAFLSRLIEEELVVTGEPTAIGREPLTRTEGHRRPFTPPSLQSYRDMQDMLSLDPIHDVEAAGWPVPRADDESNIAPAP